MKLPALGRTQDSWIRRLEQPGLQTPAHSVKGGATSIAKRGCTLHPRGKEVVPARGYGRHRGHSFPTYLLFPSLSSVFLGYKVKGKVLLSCIPS